MKKQLFSAILGTTIGLSSVIIPINSNVFAQSYNMDVSSSLIAMTEEEEVSISFKTDLTTTEGLKWYFGDVEISEYKTYNKEDGKFTGDEYITFSKAPEIKDGKLTATLKFGLLFNGTHASSNKYLSLIGEKTLVAKDSNGNILAESKPIKLNVYDNYLTYDEMKEEIQSILNNASKDRYVAIENYGTSINGEPMNCMIIAKDKSDVDTFLNSTNPTMLSNPQKMIDEINNGKDYKIPLLFSSIHAAEQPNSDSIVALAKLFSKESNITFKNHTENQNMSLGENDDTIVDVDLDVDDVLDNFILVFNFTQNPDGNENDVRQNAYGFDPNRDNGYQVFQEQQSMVSLINKYNPLVFLDLHGFVSDFLIEPCTPPHDPNTESDLLIEGLLSSAHAIGKAGVANSKYESYDIPLIDEKEGWDDATSAYTATYSLFQGVIGHTVEVPEKNEEGFKAGLYGSLGAIKNALENKDMFFLNKLEIYKRGIEKAEVESVNEMLINPDGTIKGREKDNNPTFFPDYYIIPTNMSLQKSPAEAHNIVTYLERNDVDVQKLSKSYTIDDVTYPAGSYVVNMAQAKRGYANHVLYEGSDESLWGEMYAEIVMNFPALKGFDVYPIFDNTLELETTDIDEPTINKISINKQKSYILYNDTAEAVKAANKLLYSNKPVSLITDGEYKGSFIVKGSDIYDIYRNENITLLEKTNNYTEKSLSPVKVYNTGEYQTKYVLEQELGFTLVDNINDADVVIDASGKTDYLGKKPFIAIGGKSMQALENSGLLNGFDSETTDLYHEGLLNVDTDSPITGTYNSEDTFYSASGTWINSVPENFNKVVTISDEEDFYIAGWWPNHDLIKGKTMIAEGTINEQETVLIAGNPENRGRTSELFNWISNSIYMISE